MYMDVASASNMVIEAHEDSATLTRFGVAEYRIGRPRDHKEESSEENEGEENVGDDIFDVSQVD